MNPDQPEPEPDIMPTSSSLSSRSPVDPGTRSFPPGAIPTEFLFQGTQEILINHNGEHYRLRITKNGKLILTK
jgi:hemin uptake protein HemP